ncbi:hypothetical protein F8O01_03140 [Pseudoclavibacter chungangensis]|uniref:Uncharacterized protein n=1 Tax=Pseudoclavibacter chungangensis TaxID=587635 RepID=A0A7J5C0A5_9MICO|nr:hypothetical protein [Pseudoclavibacter chungangensis]KAB1660334.1 hypothetical protein F8O01_03140 [Pseudoclavibacter chungangensis]NYJ65690.1 amino acid transporter [Pseudoclavibacter chungangensis]
MTKERVSVAVVWVVAFIGVLTIPLLATPERHVTWASVLLLVLVCMTCVIQLGMQESRGFVRRMSLSLVGAFVILSIASLIYFLMGGGAGVLDGHG